MKNLCIVYNGHGWPLCANDNDPNLKYSFIGCLPRFPMIVGEDRAKSLISEIEANPKFTIPPYTYKFMVEKKIKSARITEMPKAIFDPMPKVMVKLEDSDEEILLFEYYPDEISFTSSEFIGLTVEEGKHLKFVKDKNYLQS